MTRKGQNADEVRQLMEQQKDHDERVFGVRPDIVLDATVEDSDWRVAFRARELTPEERQQLPRIQALFHGLIRSRCAEGRIPPPKRLPILRTMKIRSKPRWLAVSGMVGGFAYRLEDRQGELTLVAESWSRVSDGSGMRHAITATQVILEERGFV